MKKIYSLLGGFAAVRIVNDEIFTALVILAALVVVIVKYFPIFMEGTK